ncbi:MAG: hypothetical protein PHS41_08645 [Victivallaceae bacterium]|nr:hypothetical protein [Victivallaceae bacterium]
MKKSLESSEKIRVGPEIEIPVRFVDEDGDVLEFDGESQWIAKDAKGEIIKRLRF